MSPFVGTPHKQITIHQYIKSSGTEAPDQYLKIQASQDIKKNVAITYVLTEQNADQISGFYTISSIGIFPGELPAELAKKLPRYPVLPGILLGRLAVNESMKRNSIGTFLLMDALKRSLAVSHQIGIVAVIVDAKDAISVNFYKHFGFIPFRQMIIDCFCP